MLLDRYVHDLTDVPFVHHDDIAVGRGAGAYLKALGCNRILIVSQGSRIGSDFTITPLKNRAAGCQEIDGVEVIRLPAAGTDEAGGLARSRVLRCKGEGSKRMTVYLLSLTALPSDAGTISQQSAATERTLKAY